MSCILASEAALATALDVAHDASLTVTGGAAPAARLLSAFVESMFSNVDTEIQLLRVPSIIGELWMMACLIIVGVRGVPWSFR